VARVRRLARGEEPTLARLERRDGLPRSASITTLAESSAGAALAAVSVPARARLVFSATSRRRARISVSTAARSRRAAGSATSAPSVARPLSASRRRRAPARGTARRA
jgi:hypothetical protein